MYNNTPKPWFFPIRKLPLLLVLCFFLFFLLAPAVAAQTGEEEDEQVYLPITMSFQSDPVQFEDSGDEAQVYFGAWMDGDHYGLGDAPWITQTIDNFETNAGKRVSILHWGQAWHWNSQAGYAGIGDGKYQKFESQYFESIRQRGTIPMINWNSWELSAGGSVDQPDYQLSDIISGNHDAYITQWARDAAAWGKPFFLRFNHEMNGNWYPWSEQRNANQSGEFVLAWRHVHDLFVREGATNVTWVWTVNVEYDSNPYSSNLEGLYPGDTYVDWVAIDGYNWGAHPAHDDAWKPFSEVFTRTYNHILQVAPSKPVMIAEFASTEMGGSKADWITDALATQIPINFPGIKAVVWTNQNSPEGSFTMDWIIESSKAAQTAFASAIASPYYTANDFAGLATSPIPPPGDAQPAPSPSPTATPTVTSTPGDAPPTVSITSPAGGATVTRTSTVTISASASDDLGVVKVEFFVNNRLKCTDAASPYTCRWKVTGSKNATFSLKAVAYDQGNKTGSHTLSVTAN